MPPPYDLVVVGAGPAGAAAALRALQLRPDARVALLDKASFPRDKACGDGVCGQAVDLLRTLGVPDVVSGHPAVRRLRVTSPGGAVAVADTARASWIIPRRVLDGRLVEAAVRRGAALHQWTVRRCEQRGNAVVLDGELVGRVVLGADGVHSTIRRLIGTPPAPTGTVALAIRGYAPRPPDPPEQLIALQRQDWPAYAWSFPIGGGQANVGYGLLLDRLRRRAEPGRAVLQGRLTELLPDQPAEPGSLRAAHLPLSTGRPRLPAGRVLLAGDAAGLVNPLTGEGIHYAVLSGALAGSAAVLHPGDPGGAYQAALRSALGRHLRHTDVLGRLTRCPAVVDAAVTAAARSPRVFEELMEVGLAAGTVSAGTVSAGIIAAVTRAARTSSANLRS